MKGRTQNSPLLGNKGPSEERSGMESRKNYEFYRLFPQIYHTKKEKSHLAVKTPLLIVF